jgi:hypothetical protein
MAYIGKQPLVGNFIKLDAITTSATTTFNLTNGGIAYYPQSANNCLVSLNGILQAPTDSYTISGSTIVFSSALTTSDVIDFIIVLGDVLNIGTPSDNTVSLAKLTATGTKDSTTFLRGDNTFASAGATAGTIIQVVTATDATERSTNSTSYVTASNTLSVSITPSSSSNKIFILVSTTAAAQNTTQSYYTIFKNGSNLVGANGMFNGYGEAGTQNSLCAISYLDSPATTSATTYQVYFKKSGGYDVFVNYGTTTGSITAFEIKG